MDENKARLLVQKIDASILMLEQIRNELKDFLNVEKVYDEVPQIEETWLGDDGKVYQKSNPYKKAQQWYCCGKPLERATKNGKEVYHCNMCNSDYSG